MEKNITRYLCVEQQQTLMLSCEQSGWKSSVSLAYLIRTPLTILLNISLCLLVYVNFVLYQNKQGISEHLSFFVICCQMAGVYGVYQKQGLLVDINELQVFIIMS